MVRVEYEHGREERDREINDLLNEVYGERVKVDPILTGVFEVRSKETGGLIGILNDTIGRMDLRNSEYEEKTVKFGERYEKEIGLLNPNLEKEFVIQTTYRK